MRDVTVEAKTGVGTDSEKSFTTTVNLPETVEEAIKSYGSDEVFKIWYGATIVRIQGNMRKPEGAKNTKTLDVVSLYLLSTLVLWMTSKQEMYPVIVVNGLLVKSSSNN